MPKTLTTTDKIYRLWRSSLPNSLAIHQVGQSYWRAIPRWHELFGGIIDNTRKLVLFNCACFRYCSACTCLRDNRKLEARTRELILIAEDLADKINERGRADRIHSLRIETMHQSGNQERTAMVPLARAMYEEARTALLNIYTRTIAPDAEMMLHLGAVLTIGSFSQPRDFFPFKAANLVSVACSLRVLESDPYGLSSPSGWHRYIDHRDLQYEHDGQCSIALQFLGTGKTWNRDWNSNTVAEVASSIYNRRAFEQTPILADALEDAGCADATILNDLRNRKKWFLGDWILDRARKTKDQFRE